MEGRRLKRTLYVIPIVGDQLYSLFSADGSELPVGMICAAFDEGDDPSFPNRFRAGLHKAERGFSQILMDIELRQLKQKSWDWMETRNLVDASLKAAAYKGATTKLLSELRVYVLELHAWAMRCHATNKLDSYAKEQTLKLDLMRFRPYYSWCQRARVGILENRLDHVVACADVMLLRFELERIMWPLSNAMGLAAQLDYAPQFMDQLMLTQTAMVGTNLDRIQTGLTPALEALGLDSSKVSVALKEFDECFNIRAWNSSKGALEKAHSSLNELIKA